MELIHEQNRIFATDDSGKTVAEVLFPDAGEGLVRITSTRVDPSLRGQGVAARLLEAAARQLRSQGKKAVPVCSYAQVWFERNSAYADLLAKDPGQ